MQRTLSRGAFAASLSLAASAAPAQNIYSNLATYLNDGVVNNGAASDGSGGLKTLMIADDLTLAPGSAGKAIDSYSFTVRNFNGVSVSARTLVTIYADNGANAPGALLNSATFAPSTHSANSIQTFTIGPGNVLFNVPASGKIWVGMAFDNRQGLLGTTAAQLDLLGQGAYGPPTIGSSGNSVFISNAVGNYTVNDPVGHLENPGFSLGWSFSERVPANVSWTDTGAGTWDPTIPNWTGGSPNANLYVNGDHATFGLSAGGSIIIPSGIAPGSTTVNAASGTYSFIGEGLQSGTLTKKDFGRLILQNPNTFTGDTTVWNSGTISANGSGAHLTLSNPTNNALSGDLHIGVADAAATGVAKVSLAQSNQIADNRVIYFDSPSGRFAYFSLRGNSETVAGIHSTASGGAIENGNLNGAINTDSTLTLAPPAATTYSYGGIIRDADSGGGTGKLNIVVNGAGTQELTTGSYTYTGTTTVNAGTLQLATSLTTSSSSFTIASGATVRLTAGGNKVLATNAVSASGTGKLDLTNNDAVLRSTTLSAVRTLIATGFNGGNWQGAGITSSSAAANPGTALGYADNGVLARSSFAGVNGLDADDVLVKYTYFGDSDLSGVTTLDDFTLFLTGYQGAAPASWFRGDYNYDGSVTLDDFNLFITGYQQQGAPLSEIEAMINAAPLTDAERAAMLAAVQAIPEPATTGVVALAATLGLAAARRRRTAISNANRDI